MYTKDAMQANLGFAVKQTSHVESEVYKIRYPDLDYASLIPVDTSAHPFAKTVTYYSMDGTGRADWVNGNGKDVPTVATSLQEHETQVYTAGISYEFGYEEMMQAQKLGINLTTDKAAYARRAYEQMIYDVALIGDPSKGFQGLLNHSDVAAAPAAATGTGNSTAWADKSADMIVNDFNAGLIGINRATRTVELADTVLLPVTAIQELSSRRVPDTAMSILQYIKANNAYTGQTNGRPITIQSSRELEEGGVGGTRRMMTYRKSPGVVKLHIPMMLRFMAVQPQVFNYVVPGMFRLGGVDFRLPGAATYQDGI